MCRCKLFIQLGKLGAMISSDSLSVPFSFSSFLDSHYLYVVMPDGVPQVSVALLTFVILLFLRLDSLSWPVPISLTLLPAQFSC